MPKFIRESSCWFSVKVDDLLVNLADNSVKPAKIQISKI
jgi:hypothetical protein